MSTYQDLVVSKDGRLEKILFDSQSYGGGEYKAQVGDIERLYRYAEYYAAYTVVGTALEKRAMYPISSMYIIADADKKKTVEDIVRKIGLRQRLMEISMKYSTYGLVIAIPMKPIKKQISCKSCGQIYDLRDLMENGKKTYRFRRGKFRYKCTNKECNHYGKNFTFNSVDSVIKDPSKINIGVWSPYQIKPIRNDITGETRWIYRIPPETIRLIEKGDHFILCGTPKLYIDAVFLSNTYEIEASSDKIHVFEAPTSRIDGKPMPPLARAFRSLSMNEAYMAANRNISKTFLIPFRTLFPVDRGTMDRPIQNTIDMPNFKTAMRVEINKWLKDPNYIPVMPLEIGSKDFWGNGKLLVTDQQVRSNTQDILAEIGVPLEFIYGGATWSRQNVSTVILENSFKVLADILQGLLDDVSDIINETIGLTNKCSIRLGVPRLVEAMAENSYLKEGMEAGDISKQTYYNNYNINYNEEKKRVNDDHEVNVIQSEERGKNLGLEEVARLKVVDGYQIERRETERKERLKDSLVMSAIQNDDIARQISSEKQILDMNAKMQTKMERKSIKIITKAQIKLLEEQSKMQIDGMKQQMNIEAQNIEKQMLAQNKAETKINDKQQKEQEEMLISAGEQSLTDPERKQMERLSKEQTRAFLIEKGTAVSENSDGKGKKKGKGSKSKTVSVPPPKEDEVMKIVENLSNMPEGEEKYQAMLEIQGKYPEYYEQIISMSKEETIKRYVGAIINSAPGGEQELIQEIEEGYPDILDTVGREVKKQMVVLEQAKEYAYELYKNKDNKSIYMHKINEINKYAPTEFRIMIFRYYENLVNTELDNVKVVFEKQEQEKKLIKKQDKLATNIARQLMAMSEEIRNSHLAGYRHEDPVLFDKITMAIAKIRE